VQGFPDVENALCELLASLGATGTATDEDLTIPIRVNRTGGPVTSFQDNAIVDVTAFRATRAQSVALNARIVAALNDRRAIPTTAGFIDKITNFVSPLPLPDLNPDIRKVVSTWTVTSRLQEVPDPA
jgi:hypothetical protein